MTDPQALGRKRRRSASATASAGAGAGAVAGGLAGAQQQRANHYHHGSGYSPGYGHHSPDAATMIAGRAPHDNGGRDDAQHHDHYGRMMHQGSTRAPPIHVHDHHFGPRSLEPAYGRAGGMPPHHLASGDHAAAAISGGQAYKEPSSSSGLGGWVEPPETSASGSIRNMNANYLHPEEQHHQRFRAGEPWSHAPDQGYLHQPHQLGQQPSLHPGAGLPSHPFAPGPYGQADPRWAAAGPSQWQSPALPPHFEQPIAHHLHQQGRRVSPPFLHGDASNFPPHLFAPDDEQRTARQASRQISASSDDVGSAREDAPVKQRKGSKTGSAEAGRAPVMASTTPGTKGFVACVPCRQRKIKCNGVRPQCTNCASKSLPCSYDEVVKRRGPDKQPGGRMRKREGKPQEEAPGKPARSIKGTARAGHDSPRHSIGEQGGRLPEPGADGHDFTFGATLHPGMALGMPPNHGMPPGPYNGSLDSPSVQTRHRFEVLSIETPSQPFGRSLYQPDGGVSLDPSLQHPPVPPLLPSQLPHGPAGVLAPAPVDPQTGFSWMVQPAVTPVSPVQDVKPATNGSFSPRMALQDLLINGSAMMLQSSQASARQTATISPFTDSNSNEGSDGPVTPPEISIHLERMPNIAYARDQDWVWMTGLLSDQRDQGMAILDARLREVFDMGLSWFSCINRSAFFGALHHPAARLELQPALILALLACSTLFRTGADGPDHPGRQLACGYADAARSMIQQSIIGNKADPSLAQAALALCIFETCPHPQHSLDRTAGALKQMDSIMQMFCLFAIDVADDRVSIFLPEQVPKLALTANGQTVDQPVTPQLEGAIVFPGSQPNNVPSPWSPQPDWPVYWTEGDMRKDESRRVAWTASAVVATFSAWSQAMGRRPLDLYCAQPENYALFFPAEVLLLEDQLSAVPVGKRTVWALFHRLVLLWHFSIKNAYMPHDPVTRATIASDILAEVDSIEQCLTSSATQQSERGNVYRWQSRDWILHIRRLMKYGYGAGADDARDKLRGKQWLATQAQVAESMANAMNGQAPSALPSLQNRPMYVWWLLGQAKTACDLYENDNSLDSAVELAGGLWRAIDMLVDKWPCNTAKAVALAFKARFDKILQHQSSVQVSPLSN